MGRLFRLFRKKPDSHHWVFGVSVRSVKVSPNGKSLHMSVDYDVVPEIVEDMRMDDLAEELNPAAWVCMTEWVLTALPKEELLMLLAQPACPPYVTTQIKELLS